MIGDINPYNGRKNMVVVWMTQMNESFEAPGFKATAICDRNQKAKAELAKQIIAKLDEICEN